MANSGVTAPYSVIAGPATVYIAPYSTAFPAVNTDPPGGSWVSLGRTQGGVTVQHQQTVNLINADQATGPIKAIRSAEGLNIDFTLIDCTLENFAYAMNNATVTAAAGPPAIKTVKLHQGRGVAQFAMLVRGDSPYGNFYLQYGVPLVVNQDQPQLQFQESGNVGIHVVFTALEDPAQATDADRFGTVVAQTS